MSAPEATSSGRMLVISGPSGCGKSTLCKRLLEDDRVEFSISATTRPMREGETDGREYHFLDADRFRERVEAGDFVEWAEVHGNLYGTLRAPLDRAVADGKIFLIEIDVQGALQLKALEVEGLYVFISPPSAEVLRARLEGRATDSQPVIERRLKKAADEMLEAHRYDATILNDNLDRAFAELQGLVGLSNGCPQGEAR
ncbi:MAG: guanylate kinase [Planctomycetota bacterium]|nr:guanylate kinase [Planctomycetota bacterium]MDG2144819.1 guanylate kinase [Planctomycetota bacterium]